MGQLLLPDNIPNIVVASTTSVTLAATNNGQTTTVTVGGQQYALSSTLTLNTGSTGANGLDTGSLGSIQLWYVYTIANSSTFALALIASQTGPATGPTIPGGYYSAYKLVGAFYTNGSSQVGSVVTITGTAQSDWFSFTPSGSWTTNTTYTGKMKRNGPDIEFEIQMSISGAPNSSALIVNNPTNITTDVNRLVHSTNDGLQVYGMLTFLCQNKSTSPLQGVVAYRTNSDMLPRQWDASITGNPIHQSNMSDTSPAQFSNGDFIELKCKFPVVGWNATLL